MAWRYHVSGEEQKQLSMKLKQMLVHCIGFDGDELAQSRKDSFDYYFQRKRGDEVVGRSSLVTGDVSSMTEGNLALMTEPLLDKRIAEFCAYDEADEEQANLESDCVQTMLFKRQNGFIELTSAIKDALQLRNAVIKIYVDKRTHKKQIRRENVDPLIVTEVLDQIGQTDVHSFDPETGQLSATLTKTTRKFRVEALAPENFLYPKDWHRQDLEDIPFCAERHVEARSTLLERGFPKSKVMQLRRWNNPYQAAADARLPRNVTPNSMPIDVSQELVEWYEAYVKMDDGNGTSELRRICFSDQWVLEDDIADLICYATGVAIINPHTFMGISLFDKLKWVQDSTTALTRALMDNLNATNKNRTAHLDGVCEEQDITDGRTNGSIRVNPQLAQDVRQAIMAFGVPDTSANILANLDHFRSVRSESGGAALDMATGQMQLNDRVGSQGLDRAYSVMESLALFMTRILANTLVRAMYMIAHETLRTQWKEPIMFKRGNKWVKTNPAEWRVRDAVEVNLGKSMNDRARESAVLERLLDRQAFLAANGMEEILVGVNEYHAAMNSWLRVNDIENPEKFMIDPRSDEAIAAMKRKAQNNQQAQQKQDALLNQAVALEQVRAALEKYRIDVETQFKYYAEVLSAQIEEAKITSGAVVELRKLLSTSRIESQRLVSEASNDTGRPKESSEGATSESAVE
jgi:hypothetical protein